MTRLLFAGMLVGFAVQARAEAVPGEVVLAGGEDVAALCAELGADDGEQAAEARRALYAIKMPSSAFAFLAYDGHRARLSIDATRGFRAKDGSYELVLHDLGGSTRARASALEMAIPATSSEAAAIAKAHRAATLSLTIWFRVAELPDDVPSCATVHTAGGEGTRVAIDPLAFLLAQGSERIASGETAEVVALRQAAAAREPKVIVSHPVSTRGGAKASDGAARVAAALERPLLACYRAGLADDAGLRGSLVVALAIAGDGRVTEARAEIDGLGAAKVVDCVLAEVRATRFPRGAADRWSLPLKFTSE